MLSHGSHRQIGAEIEEPDTGNHQKCGDSENQIFFQTEGYGRCQRNKEHDYGYRQHGDERFFQLFQQRSFNHIITLSEFTFSYYSISTGKIQ